MASQLFLTSLRHEIHDMAPQNSRYFIGAWCDGDTFQSYSSWTMLCNLIVSSLRRGYTIVGNFIELVQWNLYILFYKGTTHCFNILNAIILTLCTEVWMFSYLETCIIAYILHDIWKYKLLCDLFVLKWFLRWKVYLFEFITYNNNLVLKM